MESSESPEDLEPSYSLVNHKYYCHKCQKRYSRLLPKNDPIICEVCGDDFTELMNNEEFEQMQKEGEADGAKEAEEPPVYTQEEVKFERPTTSLRDERRQNEFNPYYDLFREFEQPQPEMSQSSQGPHVMLNDFFGGVGGINNMFDGMFVMGGPRTLPQRPNQNARGSSNSGIDLSSAPRRRARRSPFGLFGMFDFPSIFNDSQFRNFGDDFQNVFDPGAFMNNFHSNFRSSNAFQEFINRTMAEQQPTEHPAAKEAVEKLPIIKINETHCKKKEDSDDLEPPSCPVCIEEIGLGNDAMFMPCGHTFHPDCLKPWLAKNNTCPICRKELPTES